MNRGQCHINTTSFTGRVKRGPEGNAVCLVEFSPVVSVIIVCDCTYVHACIVVGLSSCIYIYICTMICTVLVSC